MDSSPSQTPIDADDRQRLALAAAGDSAAWQDLIRGHHQRLRRMVAVRLDTRLAGRIDPSDVLQDTYLEASERLPKFIAEEPCPLFLWLRTIAGDRIQRLHRYHLGTQARDAGREVSLVPGHLPEVSSESLARQLVGREPSPSQAAMDEELVRVVRETLQALEPLDREILAMRHFEQLSSSEAAAVLGITVAASAKRYFRSLARLKEALADHPGGLDGFLP
jgi:RNA polymerase sigma-70 factor, ECF subfamily